MKALESLDDLTIMTCMEEDLVEEYVIKCYLAIRMKPLVGIAGANVNRVNNMAEFLFQNYKQNEYSIDLMVNAVYNYINEHKHCPTDKLLSDDIEILLDEYAD